MKLIVIIDEFLDEREFRNYSSSWLAKLGFTNIIIDDPRISDKDLTNDNDFLATKNDIKYTIQTFLNRDITKKDVDETLEDMKKENVENGIIITNKKVSNQFREYASEKSVEIFDRRDLIKEE